MTAALESRGPDDNGVFCKSTQKFSIGLGHQRLSILDLSTRAKQPMRFENLTLVYNGEVYNYLEVQNELEAYGYNFLTNSDTEVILKAFHKWGVECVHRFNGMFAIAIYNENTNYLTLLRDRAGVKPLYWYFNRGVFMFASELKSFHENHLFNKKLNNDALGLYFQYGYIPQPHSIFMDTFKLQSGSYLTLNLKNEQLEIKNYWDVISYYNKPKLDLSEETALLETEALMKKSCQYRMISDVPVGVFLSGGYDSSAVTALLQSDMTEKLKTFSIGFYDSRLNEAEYSKAVTSHLGTDHTEYYCTSKDVLSILPLLPEICDEPLADNSIIPTTLVSKLAREYVKVSLSADGGDEIFGGYDKYINASLYQKLFRTIPNKNSIPFLFQKISPELLGLDNLFPQITSKYYRAVSIMSLEAQVSIMQNLQKIFLDHEFSKLNLKLPRSPTYFDDLNKLRKGLPDLDKMMATDFKTYLTDNILFKVDRATMSVGLEGREPLLDHRLIEFVARLDPAFKISGGHKKYLIKRIVHKYLPKKLMDRPKMGFSMPLADWLGTDCREYLDLYIEPSKFDEHGLLNGPFLIEMKKKFLQGQKHYAEKLWTVLIFQMWYERWMF